MRGSFHGIEGSQPRGTGIRTIRGFQLASDVSQPHTRYFYLCLMPLLDSSPENPFSSWDWAQVLHPVPYWAEWDSSWNSYISRGSWALPAPDIPSIWPHSILCHSHPKNKTPPGTAQPTCFSLCFQGSEGLFFLHPLTHSLRLLLSSLKCNSPHMTH